MAFIEAHQSLRDHRKILALAAELDMPEPHVAGHCLYLWLWGLDNAEDGVLPASMRIIERAACWLGTPGALVTGMLNAGMLDRDEDGALHIHGWWEYAGRFVEKRRQNAERMRNARAVASREGDDARAVNVQRTCDECAGATVPNRIRADLSPRDPSRDLMPPAPAQAPLSPPSAPAVASAGDPGDSPVDDRQGSSHTTPVPEPSPKPPKLKPIYGEDSVPMQLARSLGAGIHRNKPDAKLPHDGLQGWAREFDLMLRVDHRPREKIEAVIAYAMRNPFWRSVVFSAAQIRRKFDVIDAQRQEDASGTRNRQAANGNGAPRQPSRGYSNAPRRLPTQDEYRDLARKLGQIPPDTSDGRADAGDRRADEAASGESAGSAAPLAQATGT